MFRLSSKNKQKVIDDAAKSFNEELDGLKISRILDENITIIQRLFADVDILHTRRIENTHDDRLKFCLVYCEAVADMKTINQDIIKPLISSNAAEPGRGLIDELIVNVLQISNIKKTDSFGDIVNAICYGDTVLFADGVKQALIMTTQSYVERALTEPENEKNLTGPREGFNESLMTNLSLLRRKVRTHELKMKFITLGRRTQTRVSICYMEGMVNKKILQELYRRLDTVDIDSVLDTNYITELIRDSKMTPFRTIGYTERPDIVIGRLLEGRIAVLVDGSPSAITLPYLFVENFQSSEDYYLNFYYTSFSRSLRMLGFFLTSTVPAIYIAIGAFHHEMLPTQLLINMATERTGAPLPAALEAFLMLIIFDILRETGVRMPVNIGQALSIVGALVIGQAAVEAKLVAAPMVIIVGVTGITSLLVPKLNAPMLYLRFGLLFLASMFGLYGLVIGSSIIVIHIINLRSFGVPQISYTANLKTQDIKDTFFRASWTHMKERPKFAWDKRRMKTEDKK